MSRIKKAIVIGPSLKKKGGVSSFYGVAKKYFTSRVIYWEYEVYLRSRLLSLFLSIFLWFPVTLAKLAINARNPVIINPSLMPISVCRNLIIALVYKCLGGKDLFVFWRGWNVQNEYLIKYSIVHRALVFNAQHMVLNQTARSFLSNNLEVKAEDIHEVSTMVDNIFFKTKIDNNKYLNQELFRFIFLSRVEKYKGIYESIEIIRRSPHLQLDIYGTGLELKNIKNNVLKENKERIRLKGFVSGNDKIKAFESCHIYVLLSASEGMPNSLLEAMALGLPVVCTDVGAMSDFFEDGKMGIRVTYPVDISELVSRIENLINDQDKLIEIQAYNRSYAEGRFKASNVIRRIENIIFE